MTTVAITGMRKRADESIVAKREAQKRHRRIYSNVARIQEGLYRLAGLDELADRIRATVPRKAREAEEAAEPNGAPESPEPSAESAAEPAES